MNIGQRIRLQEAFETLSDIRDEEQDKIDNAPANLAESETYQRIQDIVDALDDVIDSLERIIGD